MLLLMCRDDAGRYALPTSAVVEVIPRVEVNLVARHLHSDWADSKEGVLNYRGQTIPVVDLTLQRTGQPSASRWNTRIVVIRYDAEASQRLAGLVVERVKATELDDQVFRDTDSSLEGRFGPVLIDDVGMFEVVDPTRLMSRIVPGQKAEGPPT